MVVVDSSVFVAAFREGEPHSEPAIRLIEAIEVGVVQAVIPETVLIETVSSIRRRTGDPALARLVRRRMEGWQDLTAVRLGPAITSLALDLATKVGLRGMDTVVLATAMQRKLSLVTFDREFARLAGDHVAIVALQDLA